MPNSPAISRIYPRAADARVFWFFSSEKNILAFCFYELRCLPMSTPCAMFESALKKGNFLPGDLSSVEQMITNLCPSEDMWHAIGFGITELLKSGEVPSDESRGILLKLYEETPCSLCRGAFVEKLVEAGHVPDWMANEARFDVDPETASLFA